MALKFNIWVLSHPNDKQNVKFFIKFLLLDKKWQGLQYCHFHPYQHKILYGPKWSSMVWLFPIWSGMVPYCPILSSMILYCPLWSIIILYDPAWFSLGYIYGRFFSVTNFFCCKMCFCWFCNRCHFLSYNKIFLKSFLHIIWVLDFANNLLKIIRKSGKLMVWPNLRTIFNIFAKLIFALKFNI